MIKGKNINVVEVLGYYAFKHNMKSESMHPMSEEPRITIDELKKLSQTVSERLWGMVGDSPNRPHLIFPEYRDDRVRISEQESKILFANALEQSRWFYSVETPTTQTYIQSGSTPLSARTDISLYSNSDRSSKLVNIELKAHNPSKESFRKDLEKLLREGLDGLWFHTLENYNRGTLPNIYGKILQALSDLRPHLKGKDRSIMFAFCVLEKRELIYKLVPISDSIEESWSRIQSIFSNES
jgi:hypothetical protein